MGEIHPERAANADEIQDILDRIPGAWEEAQQGLADAGAGRVIALSELTTEPPRASQEPEGSAK